ncbi:MAG: glycoside hydrolase family 13 protein, partial [Nocardioidaceae bacterium]
LDRPHHDGSALYVDHPAPSLGADVGVRVWVPHLPDGSPAADRVLLRSVRDGEPALVAAVADGSDEFGCWWRAVLRVHNPLTTYRFLLSGGTGGYRWLNGSGIHHRDVTDASDFKISTEHGVPDWVQDAIGYQVFPDRFAATDAGVPLPAWAQRADWDDPVVHQGPDVPYQLYGGTLDGIVEHLDHLDDLGADLLYLTPFFAARSNHRYDALSFDEVDPLLGGDAALDRLIEHAHRAGVRVVGDITTNHTGDAHAWFRAARSDPDGPERTFYRFHDEERYESWLGVPSLPKLDHSSPEMRKRLYDGPGSVIATWIERGLDGWRVDVANMTGRMAGADLAHDVARRIRASMAAVSDDAWLLAEHGHDASHDLRGDGWQGTMDYAGFTRPVWCWLNGGSADGPGHPHGLTYLGLPVDVPVLDGAAVATTMAEVHAAMPWCAWTASTSHLDSHDTPRFRTVAGGGTNGWVDHSEVGRSRHLVGLALQMTLPGVPVIFMGDELGLTGVDGEHSRTPFPWGRADEWDRATLDAYRAWSHLRRDRIALRRGGLRWAHLGADSLTYLREHPDQRILVHVARAGHPPVELRTAGLGIDSSDRMRTLHGEPVADVGRGVVRLPDQGPAAHVYLLEPSSTEAVEWFG